VGPGAFRRLIAGKKNNPLAELMLQERPKIDIKHVKQHLNQWEVVLANSYQ
jgi:hypothetical protein